jgi:membrane protein implicated in regulation of membrane protease activity
VLEVYEEKGEVLEVDGEGMLEVEGDTWRKRGSV